MHAPIIRVVFFTLAIAGALAPQRVLALDPVATCPQIWSFSRIGHLNLYALTLRANAPVTTDVSLKIRAGGDAYTATLPAIAIDRSTAAALVPFRSNVIVFPEVNDQKITDVVVAFHGVGGECPSEARSAGPDAAVHPAYTRVPAYQDLYKRIAAESLTAVPVDVYTDPNPTTLCTDKDAFATHAVVPEYPPIAKAMGAVGVTLVIIDIDNVGKPLRADIFSTSGNESLDKAARTAALSSSYQSATIGCIKTAGLYIFRADFIRQ